MAEPLPPHPDRWKPATLVLVPGADGHEGQIQWDGMVIYVRRWHRAASGVVKCELQHQADAAMQALVDAR